MDCRVLVYATSTLGKEIMERALLASCNQKANHDDKRRREEHKLPSSELSGERSRNDLLCLPQQQLPKRLEEFFCSHRDKSDSRCSNKWWTSTCIRRIRENNKIGKYKRPEWKRKWRRGQICSPDPSLWCSDWEITHTHKRWLRYAIIQPDDLSISPHLSLFFFLLSAIDCNYQRKDLCTWVIHSLLTRSEMGPWVRRCIPLRPSSGKQFKVSHQETNGDTQILVSHGHGNDDISQPDSQSPRTSTWYPHKSKVVQV